MSKLLPLLFTVLFVPGFFSRTDTCASSMVDEQEHKNNPVPVLQLLSDDWVNHG
jgi:hypothetical protein